MAKKKSLTKKDLIGMLKEANLRTKDMTEDLRSRIEYALKMTKTDITKITVRDIKELLNEVNAVPAVEAKAKPKLSTAKKAKAEKPVEEAKEPEKVKTKAKTKVKPKAIKNEVDTLPPASTVGVDNLPSAILFPDTLDHKELGKLEAHSKLTSWKDFKQYVEAGNELYIAAYWTKRQLKEFAYAENKMVKIPKDGFPDDLDILSVVLTCETVDRAYAMSVYTEALFQFEGEDLQYVEDVDPRSGKETKFKVRVSAGMEFELYIPA